MGTVASEIAQAIKSKSSTHIFGLIGEGNMVLANAITDDAGMTFVGARHESAAIGMADGYARATGFVGIATVTQGPGVTNTITALLTAQNAHTPILLLAPEVPESEAWHIQKLDLSSLAAGIGVACVELDLQNPREMIEACHEWVHRNRRPMIVRFPFPELESLVASNRKNREFSLPQSKQTEPMPAPFDGITQAVSLLADSTRPVIIIGHGVRLSDAEDAIAELAAASGAIIATTLMAKGMLEEHPHSVGVSGGFSRPNTHRLVEESDLVLVFGATLNQFTTHNGRILPNGAPIIHCDIAEHHIGRITDVDVALVGDARETAAEITKLFLEQNSPRTFSRELEGDDEPAPPFKIVPSEGLLNPEQLMHSFNEILPQDRVLVVEGGHNMGFGSRNLTIAGPRSFFVPIEFGAIGSAMGIGIGAAYGKPDACAIITIGDGSLLMSFGELETLCRYQVPCVLIVLDDGSYAAEYHALAKKEMNLEHSLYPMRDFAGVARALGAEAHTLRSLEDVAKVPRISRENLTGPLVFDCKIDVTIRGDWLEPLRSS